LAIGCDAGCQVNAHNKSINKLIAVVNYGRISNELFLYLSDAANRAYVRQLVIETYFPTKAGAFVINKRNGEGYFHDLEAYIGILRRVTMSFRGKRSMYLAGGRVQQTLFQHFKVSY